MARAIGSVTGQLQREHSARSARTYTAAAAHYLGPAFGFWDRRVSRPPNDG
jgi:hypothetical protein